MSHNSMLNSFASTLVLVCYGVFEEDEHHYVCGTEKTYIWDFLDFPEG